MLILGSHVSFNSKSQLLGSVEETLSYGANAFMFYTGAPQNTSRVPIDDMKTYEAMMLMKENNIALENVICHAPYIINLANNIDKDKYAFAKNFLRQEIERCISLGIRKIVLHPGSATKLERSVALNNIVSALNDVLVKEYDIVILLETMAGKGTELGINLDELKYIIDHVEYSDKVGICLDTCHLNDSGVDINKFDEYLELLDKKIGLDKVGCVHLNDSKNPINSKKDRHENIGFGTISFEPLINVLYSKKLENIPKILETPYIDRTYPPYKFEIMELKEKKLNPNLYDDIVTYYRGNHE